MGGFSFNSSSLQQNKPSSCLGNIDLSSSPILQSVSIWFNLKRTDAFCIFYMNIYLYTHTHTLIHIHKHMSYEANNFKTEFLFTSTFFFFFFTVSPFYNHAYFAHVDIFIQPIELLLQIWCRLYLYSLNLWYSKNKLYFIPDALPQIPIDGLRDSVLKNDYMMNGTHTKLWCYISFTFKIIDFFYFLNCITRVFVSTQYLGFIALSPQSLVFFKHWCTVL